MRHLCIKDYVSVNYGVEIKKGYIYSVYSLASPAIRIHYCHGGNNRRYEYTMSLRMEVANTLLVPLDENSEEHLFELALLHGVAVNESIIPFKEMLRYEK